MPTDASFDHFGKAPNRLVESFGKHLALNQAVAAKFESGSPVTAPGVPKNYPDAQKLVTEDCINQRDP